MRQPTLFPDRVPAHTERFLLATSAVICARQERTLYRMRVVFYVLLGALGLLVVFVQLAHAGGPKYVAGVSYFSQGLAGVPLTWAQGGVNYYTDQGDLSAVLPGASADALVADAFSQWTTIATAAVMATHGGQLAEDVNGGNVYRNSDGSISMPTDIEPSAVNKPVGIVYDQDGTVTDALLGQGAGDPSQCFENAVFGGIDNYASNAQFLHALVIMNGNCAQNSLQFTDVEYRLVRVLGRVLGLDWSQANLNVVNYHPRPTRDDFAGFPVMHENDHLNCVPITLCYPNPYQPKMDDQAALSRLYPATGFTAVTARIHGNVYFTNANGQAGQGMQGVNVVARWIDSSTGLPSRAYVATSVSGFLFSGNAGNMVTGFADPSGNLFTNWGSMEATVEGFFDLAGLPFPNGQNTTQYQLSIEGLDPMWSPNVGPYSGFQVVPSGSFQPTVVTVTLGGDLQQDLLMPNSSVQTANWFGPTTYGTPAAVPPPGDWAGTLSPYGDLDYFWFSGQTNRTVAVLVTALDENGNATESKTQPVIGMWALANPGSSPAPAYTPMPFNSSSFGTSLLNAQLLQTTGFRIGISDYRGDGRPDYRYHARVFYGDHVTPSRASMAGGTGVAILGLGFQQNTQTQMAGTAASVLAASATQLLVAAPPAADGVHDVSLLDPATNATSVLSGVLTYGAAATDTLKLIPGTNPGTPVGGQAPNPIVLQVVQSDGATPVSGASVFLTSSPSVAFSACSGASSCTVASDGSGMVSTWATILSSGVMTIVGQLAPASYSNPQQVQTTLLGTSSALDLSLFSPYRWIARGANVNLTLTSRVLSNGQPLNGKTVNFYLTQGSGTLNPPSATTDGNGYANSLLQISSMTGDVRVVVCVEPGDNSCQTFYGTAVPGSALQLQPVSGQVQFVGPGTAFQPIYMRVTDSATPPDPVQGAMASFQGIIGRTGGSAPIIPEGDGLFGPNFLPILLGSWQLPSASDGNGLVNVQPSSGGYSGDLAVEGSATTGAATLPFLLQVIGH